MTRISDEQARRNRISRQGWDLYRQHRERVTGLLVKSARTPSDTLCVLGAGNCNDLDLHRLSSSYQSITLVDLDAEALASGCESQGLANSPAIQCLGGIDLAGIATSIDRWQPSRPTATHVVEGVIQHSLGFRPPALTDKCYDVVASIGLLTQLIEMVDLALGTRHPQFVPLMSAVRIRHLRLLLELTRPGGQAWLFSEVVSSVTCPELLTTPEHQLIPVLQRAIEQHNFFTGVNPGVLQRLFSEDPELTANVASMEIPPPWLWNFFTRTYAVCAIGANKRS